MIPPMYPEMAMDDEFARARFMALRSLTHCGVIRVRIGHVPPGFILLQREEAVTAKSVAGVEDLPEGYRGFADCRLTEKGAQLARTVLRPPCWSRS